MKFMKTGLKILVFRDSAQVEEGCFIPFLDPFHYLNFFIPHDRLILFSCRAGNHREPMEVQN
jgi:hypothetical protein